MNKECLLLFFFFKATQQQHVLSSWMGECMNAEKRLEAGEPRCCAF